MPVFDPDVHFYTEDFSAYDSEMGKAFDLDDRDLQKNAAVLNRAGSYDVAQEIIEAAGLEQDRPR